MTKPKHEPTIADVMDVLVGVDKRFDAIDKRFESVENRMRQGFDVMNNRMDTIDERLIVVGQTVSKHSVMLVDIQEQLEYMNADMEHDAARIRDHERRISRLETEHE